MMPMKSIARLVVIVFLFAAAPRSALVAAQQQPPPKPAAAQDAFVPVDSPINQETIPAQRLVGIAYGLIWVLLLGYVWSVRSRLARVEREMEALGRRTVR
jgi:CcmD family protein